MKLIMANEVEVNIELTLSVGLLFRLFLRLRSSQSVWLRPAVTEKEGPSERDGLISYSLPSLRHNDTDANQSVNNCFKGSNSAFLSNTIR